MPGTPAVIVAFKNEAAAMDDEQAIDAQAVAGVFVELSQYPGIGAQGQRRHIFPLSGRPVIALANLWKLTGKRVFNSHGMACPFVCVFVYVNRECGCEGCMHVCGCCGHLSFV